jgi:hypothetical protein
MELRELIERAEKAAGSQKALGLILGQAPSYLRGAKAGLNGLPAYACVQIAELIDVPAITVIAASELITEKKPERRAIFAPFVHRAASVLIGAFVILNMSPTPANAAPAFNNIHQECILCKIANRFGRRLKKRFLSTFKVRVPVSLLRSWVPRVHHMTA